MKRCRAAVAACVLFCCTLPLFGQTGSASWTMAGVDITNSRNGGTGVSVSPLNAALLKNVWTFTTANDVSATPAVDAVNQAVYFPDWSGNLYKLSTATGAVIWQKTLRSYGLPLRTVSRSTPSLAGNAVIVGASGTIASAGYMPAYLLSVDANTGALSWATVLDPDPSAIVTGSPVIYNGVAYLRVSSAGEGVPNSKFRGSLVAVSIASGAILWQTYMTPATTSGQNPHYSGAPIWSSTPAIDVADNLIFTTTGNNYDVPESVQQCEVAAGRSRSAVVACQDPDNWADSIVALNLTTGAPVWTFKAAPSDNWNNSCSHGTPGCPEPEGFDLDFGSGPNFFLAQINGKQVPVVGAGQKSGVYWALNAQTGQLLWDTQVGPAGLLGGIQWGTAFDGTYVYAAISNSANATYELQPSGQRWNGGSWAALNPANGKVVWQVADPGKNPLAPAYPALSMGPVSVANGVMYAGSMSGAMYALSAATGATLWSFQANGSVNAAPAIVGGALYWGSGYHNFPVSKPVGTASNRFYCFAVPGS